METVQKTAYINVDVELYEDPMAQHYELLLINRGVGVMAVSDLNAVCQKGHHNLINSTPTIQTVTC